MKPIPFEFVLEELYDLEPRTKPMFGCTAVYVGPKIVFILREKEKETRDNGVWIATTHEHHASLKKEFPLMRSISVFGDNTGWQVLPSDSAEFESAVVRACEMVKQRDPRIGKIPKAKSLKAREKPAKKPTKTQRRRR
jgi:hypothetical protein